MSESRFNIDQVNLLIVRPHKSEIARFFGKIKVSAGTGCWVWENAQPGKYGRFFIRGTQHLAHRWAYAWLVEPLPIGHSAKTPVLDHLCRNTACVFPAHLELVSMAENTRRGIGVGRPACLDNKSFYGAYSKSYANKTPDFLTTDPNEFNDPSAPFRVESSPVLSPVILTIRLRSPIHFFP